MKTLFTIWLLAAAFLPVSAQGQQTPNVVFILTDDLGYYDLGCYGNPFNETPHIDGLARDGMKFTQAYSSSPVCSPSRAGLMTGIHPARHQLTCHSFGGAYMKDDQLTVRDIEGQTLNSRISIEGHPDHLLFGGAVHTADMKNRLFHADIVSPIKLQLQAQECITL